MQARSLSAPRPTAFTLVEVLVSLAIFAFAAVMLGSTYANVLTNYEAVTRRSRHDQDLAFVRIRVLREPDRRKAEAGGECSLPDDRTATWEAGITESRVGDLFHVSFRVVIREPGRHRLWEHQEEFMLLRPTWSDPAARQRLREAAGRRLAQARAK